MRWESSGKRQSKGVRVRSRDDEVGREIRVVVPSPFTLFLYLF